ncbi:MAG: hypothetical protein AAFQ54_11750 [Pseudomonadota bacterium]
MTAETHIFFPPRQVDSWLAEGAQWIDTYCRLFEERAGKLQDPDNSAFHLWHFMPPPCYEEKIGLHIEAGEAYSPAFGPSDCCLWVLQLTSTESRAELHFGDTLIQIRATENGLQCAFGERRVSIACREVKLSYRHSDGECHFAADGQTLARLPGSKSEETIKASRLHVVSGEVALIHCQSLGPRPGFICFDAALSARHRRLETERNPYRFEWGLRGIQINSLLLMAATLSDIARAAERSANSIPDLQRRIKAVLEKSSPTWRLLLDAWLIWPRWRAGSGPWPESGPWDRNAFNNGITASSVALAWRLLGEKTPKAEILTAISLRASAFFEAQNSLAFLKSSKGRNPAWWIRRSANHGLIMMLSYLTAMRLTGEENAPTAKLVQGNAMRALTTLYSDGSFCEGIHYHNFCFAQYLPYRQLIGEETPAEVMAFEALLPAVRDWVALCEDDRGDIFANFGDNVSRLRSPDRLSIASYLEQFAEQNAIPATSSGPLPGSTIESDPPMDTFVPFSRLKPTKPAIRTTPAKTRAAHGLEARSFGRNHFGHAVFFDALRARQCGLFVIGSRLQLTHNHNHDCTGFAFFCPELDITITESNTQPHQNNAVGLVQPDGKPARFLDHRDYSGKVRLCDAAAPDQALFEATMAAKVRLGKEQTRALKITRHFLFAPEKPDILIIETEVRVARKYRPFLAFNTSWRCSTPALQLLSWIEQGTGNWVPVAPEIKNTQTLFIAPAPQGTSAETTKDVRTRFLTVFSTSPSHKPKEIHDTIGSLLASKDQRQP